MKFRNDEIETFTSLFEERKELIRNFKGCNHLELWQDANDSAIFFTYSKWDTEEHLNHYRFSELFKDTWQRTKILFSEKPEAWSVNQIKIVEK